MPRYLVSFTDSQGTARHDYREGPSVAWVQQRLSMEGAREVLVHGEDVLSAEGRDLRAEGKLAPAPLDAVTRKALTNWGGTLAVLLAICLLHAHRVGGGRAALFHWSTVLTALVFVWALLSVSPLWLNGAVMWAASWNDWRRVLRLLPLLERNPLLRLPAMRFHLGLQRAKAYVGLGRLQDGLALFEQVSARSGLAEPARDSVRASLLILAKRYPEAIELRRRAAAEDPRLAFDAALALLRYGGDVEAARALLASREEVPLTEMEKLFQRYATGVLALADARFEDARDRLDAARASAERELLATPYNLFGMRAMIDAHRVLALAGLGERARAAEVLAPIARYLRVTDEAPLLARCEAAIAGSSPPA